LYAQGNGVPQDDKAAMKWYRQAAEQGHAKAQLNLGVMYGNGQGVAKDYALAYMWAYVADANDTSGEVHKLAAQIQAYLAKQMEPGQLSMARELARKCIANQYKGC
jgi:TPR repeat protein